MPDDKDPPAIPSGTDRRGFLRTLGAGAVAAASIHAAGALPPAAVPINRRGRATTLDSLHLAAFQRTLRTRFTARWPEGRAALTLVEVTDLTSRTSGAEGEVFSLLLRGSAGAALGQGTYEFTHAALGTFPMFIVPVAGEGRYAYYEAVFNRALPR